MSPPSVAFGHFLLSDWILKRVPGGLLVELVLLCQSVCFWHPHTASTSFLWAFETIGAQTFLNCCIFSECSFVTVQWPIFFSTTELMEMGCQVTLGDWLRDGSSGLCPADMITRLCVVFIEYFHFIDCSLLWVQLRKIRWCHLFRFAC